jgi:Cu/Ag efflux protein CusF
MMKTTFTVIALVACALALASCSSNSQGVSNGDSAAAADAMAVTTTTASAVVVAIDPAARTVTLERADGAQRKYRCGPRMANFGQIKVGDRVNATITDAIAVYVRHSDAPPFAAEASMVALAPIGSKPGVVMANTAEVRAKVLAVDQAARTITIESPGEMTTFPVDPGVDLKKFKKGDDIVLRVSESLALLVEAPAG